MFAEEKPFLQPLPLEAVPLLPVWRRRTVHIDGCVEVDAWLTTERRAEAG